MPVAGEAHLTAGGRRPACRPPSPPGTPVPGSAPGQDVILVPHPPTSYRGVPAGRASGFLVSHPKYVDRPPPSSSASCSRSRRRTNSPTRSTRARACVRWWRGRPRDTGSRAEPWSRSRPASTRRMRLGAAGDADHGEPAGDRTGRVLSLLRGRDRPDAAPSDARDSGGSDRGGAESGERGRFPLPRRDPPRCDRPRLRPAPGRGAGARPAAPPVDRGRGRISADG